MSKVENMVHAVIFAQGKVMGKVTAKNVEEVIGEFIIKYQDAVEADTSKEYAETLKDCATEVRKHLRAFPVLRSLADRF